MFVKIKNRFIGENKHKTLFILFCMMTDRPTVKVSYIKVSQDNGKIIFIQKNRTKKYQRYEEICKVKKIA